jgi:anti-sigma regulatory factor (Ser/Thr protein kinase)
VTALELPPTTDSVPRARRFVAHELRESSADVDTAVLLASEVVANAVLHARTVVTLRVVQANESVRVEVQDGSPVELRIHAFSPTSATGRGLRLLDALARRWGVRLLAPKGGKVVWFEVGAASETVWEVFADDWLAEAHDL